MQKGKRLPNISLKQTLTDFSPIIRRRNLSLSSKYQAQIEQTIAHGEKDVTSSIRMRTLGKCYSKKNKLFLKSQKIKKARDFTRLCQENLLEFMQLRNSVKKVTPIPMEVSDSLSPNALRRSEGSPSDASPKLSIKLLSMPIQLAFKGKNSFLPVDCTAKLRIKTEPNPNPNTRTPTKKPSSNKPRGSFQLIVRQVFPDKGMPLSPKKYDQLTLREIVQSEEEGQDRLQLFQKMRSMKDRLRGITCVGEGEKEEEPLKGW